MAQEDNRDTPVGIGLDHKKDGCCCPQVILYLVSTNCLTVQNGACPDWEFCRVPSPNDSA